MSKFNCLKNTIQNQPYNVENKYLKKFKCYEVFLLVELSISKPFKVSLVKIQSSNYKWCKSVRLVVKMKLC